jgi:hypothetical protein
MTGTETIRIAYPLSLEIAGPLVKAVGTLWPDAVIDTTEDRALVMRVPKVKPARITKAQLRALLDDEPDEVPEVQRFDGETLTVSTPGEAWQALAQWALIVLEATEGTTNYVEQSVTLRESGKQFVVIACWSKGQTPHHLRMLAERRAERAEKRLAAYEPDGPPP